jgi:hypothetical protein
VVYMECCIGLRAGVAQLVEHKLPKLGVASSNLVARSRFGLLDRTLVLPVIPFTSLGWICLGGGGGFESGLARFFLCLFFSVVENGIL